MPFFSSRGKITKRVYAAIQQRIAQAEAEFQKLIDEREETHAQAMEDLVAKHEAELVEIENTTVHSLVSKILG